MKTRRVSKGNENPPRKQGASRRAPGTRSTRWVFRLAGIYGLAVLLPQYLLEDRIGRDDPPAITHPGYFYGFIGVAVSWQVAFLVIATDPVRYRPLIVPAVLEKAAFGLAAAVLFAQGRASGTLLAFGIIDLVLGLSFVAAYWRLRSGDRQVTVAGWS